MNHIIISNCTNRKLSKLTKIEPSEKMYDIENVDFFINHWLSLIQCAKQKKTAIEIYQGRSVSEILRAKKIIDAEIIFLSAGLGIVNGGDMIPNYDLTISEGQNSLKSMFSKWRINESIWWEKISRISNNNLNLLHEAECIFIALPQNYLNMILPFLSGLDMSTLSKIRLFLHPQSVQKLPEHLQKLYIPYDYRIENSEFKGTMVDYCQRCLHHFIKYIFSPNQDITTAKSLVTQYIKSLPPIAPKIIRPKLTDDEISKLILEGWDFCNGQSSKLLRFLRDEKMIACEQSRFQALWRHIKNEKMNAQ
ncbi:hypothetical protein [Acinetobacter sp. YH16052]|uniref:hypothetical protein n=1 Tax=Acinetobacter sp. YH16052 TaxID=2601191 RepID=UPI001C5510E1|nr:hypothetical protein [Acinetobacter sp. YH16052]